MTECTSGTVHGSVHDVPGVCLLVNLSAKKKKKREKNQSINNQLQKCNYGAISAFVRNALMLKSHCDYY